MDFRSKKESSAPLVTIGILSYNNAKFLRCTLDSVLHQSHSHIELIIVDDGSIDNSLTVINDWMSERDIFCTLIIHEKNSGIAPACNDVVRNATGKYIALFGSDDIMNPLRIEKQVEILEQSPEDVAFCYSAFTSIDEQGKVIDSKHDAGIMHCEGDCFEDFYFRKFFIPAPTVLLRKKIFDEVGLYDERLVTEDYAMWLRILPFYKIRYCNYKGVEYRMIDKTIAYNAQQMRSVVEDYHRDRIFSYVKTADLIKNESRYDMIKKDMMRKINFHLIRLKLARSKHFKEALLFALSKNLYGLSFTRLFKIQVKQIFFGLKEDPLPMGEYQ
jgi:glycosyltransferase involved in cell wall biosynthesis